MKYIEEYELFENTLKKAREEFVVKLDKIDDHTLKEIIDADPTNNKKYVYWVCANAPDRMTNNEFDHMLDLMRWYHKNQQKMPTEMRDINKIKPKDIEKMQQDPKYRSKKEKKNLAKSEDNYKILYEDSKGNKVIEILNRFGCTYWTQLKDDKLKPASFCIGSYSNKDLYTQYSTNLDNKKNGMYMIILPNEKEVYRKIMLTPINRYYSKHIYDVTDMRNETQNFQNIIDFQYHKNNPREVTSSMISAFKENTFNRFFTYIIPRYPFLLKYIRGLSTLNKQVKDYKSGKDKVRVFLDETLKELKATYFSNLLGFWYTTNDNFKYKFGIVTDFTIRINHPTNKNLSYPFYGYVGHDDLYDGNNKLIIKDVFNQKPKDVVKIIHDAYLSKQPDY